MSSIFRLYQGFLQQFWEKALAKIGEKIIDIASKLGENNDRTNKG